jgi:hypothetical protein
MSIRPKHKLADSEKDKDYIKSCVDYYISQANFLGDERANFQTLYDAANGFLNENDYDYILNPYKTSNSKLTKFPSRLRNYDIISPVIKMFMGENFRKSKKSTVYCLNSDAPDKKEQEKIKLVNNILKQQFINQLNESGMETGIPSKETPDIQEAVEEFDGSYKDYRASLAQNALDVIYNDLDLDEIQQKMFYHWLVSGHCYSFKDVYLDDIVYESIDSRDIVFINWNDQTFGEDADACVVVKRMSSHEILDDFHNLISEHEESEKIVEWLDSNSTGSAMTTPTVMVNNVDVSNNRTQGQRYNTDDDTHLIYHCCWKTFKKVAILKYNDKFGIPQEMEVEADYKLQPEFGDINLDYIWINEVYHAYSINEEWVLGGDRYDFQRNSLNNPSKCKLPYNGVRMGYANNRPISVVQQGLNYQVLYNIMHYRFELLLAKNKDKILAMPLSFFPNGKGWTPDKFMYWMDAIGVAVWDDKAPKAAALINGLKSIDMSLGAYAKDMWDFMLEIKNEWWDLIGMNRQRYGDVYASDGKANNQQAVARKSVLTSDLFRQYEKFIEKDDSGLIDLSKVAWMEGKKGSYINSDEQEAFFNLEGDELLDYISSDFGIYNSNGQEEKEKREQARELLLTMGQNGMGSDILLEILDANTINRVKTLAKKGVKIERQFQEKLKKQEQESAERIAQMQNQEKQAEREAEKYKTDQDNATKLEVAMIQADATMLDVLNNTAELEDEGVLNHANDAAERIKARNEIKNQINNQDKPNLEREKMELQREKNATQLAVARENKNRHDK